MSKVTLLIVDDEAKIRNGIYTYLKIHADWLEEIYTAENGKEALNMIFKYKPTAMLLDVQMPIKDGFEVMTEAIRAKVCPKTIILSGYDEFKYAQSALRLGALDYILKPCRPQDIMSKISSILEIDIEKMESNNIEEYNPIIEKAKKYLIEHYEKDISLVLVAEVVNVTPSYLSTLFSKYEKCGFIDYLNQYRVEQAKMFLSEKGNKTYEVAFQVGFKDEKYFSKVFKKITGLNPSEYRKSKYINEAIILKKE